MKEIYLEKSFERIENAKLVDEIYQNTEQYNNIGVQIWQIGKAVIYREDLACDDRTYLLDKPKAEKALEDPEAFLKESIAEWIGNDDDPLLASLKWYPERAEDNRYEGDGKCKILVVGFYNGHQPVNWLHDEQWNDICFENSATAQAWIDEAESETYYLSHNEAGRPDYYIIED